jgi:hypothetical protein
VVSLVDNPSPQDCKPLSRGVANKMVLHGRRKEFCLVRAHPLVPLPVGDVVT